MSSIAWCEPLPWRSMQPCRERPSARTIQAMFKHLEIAQLRSAVAGDASSHYSPELQQDAPVDLHLHGAAKPPSKGVASLAQQGSSSGLDTKESKDCF